MLVIVVGAVAGWGWTRIIGATLISVGAGALGVLAGLVEPRRRQIGAWLRQRKAVITLVAAVVLVLPAVVALIGAIVGLVAASGQRAGLLALGLLTALALLAATAISAAIAVRATLRAGQRPVKEEGA